MHFSSRLWTLAFVVPFALALAPDEAGACQPFCQPDAPTHVDPDVPTDVGLRLAYDRCDNGQDRLSNGEVFDASGARVPGSFDASAGTWRPAEPLVPGAAYTLREITPRKDPQSFAFVAGAGPAPVLAPADLDLAAHVEAFTGTSACCRGESVCNYDARCVTVTTSQTWRLVVTIDGQAPRWFQQTSAVDEASVGKPKPKQPPPVSALEAGEQCLLVSVKTNGAGTTSRSVCITLGELPSLPDRCGEIVPLYEGCDTPDPSLTQLAKACGADEKGGCAVQPGSSGWLARRTAAGWLLVAAVFLRARRVTRLRTRNTAQATA